MYSSRTVRATLLSSGERIDPYEQCWIMRSVGLSGLVRSGPGVERCA
jgi:hypothetical protein